MFDERLIRNQDYELNIRLRKAGGTVWFDPRVVGRLPPARLVDGARAAVLRVRPLEGRRDAHAPGLGAGAAAGATDCGVRRGAGDRPRVALETAPVVPVAAVAVVAAESVRSGRRNHAQPVLVGTVLSTVPIAWSLGLAIGSLDRSTTDDEPDSQPE